VGDDTNGIEIGYGSMQGPDREQNQDSFGVFPRGGVRDAPPSAPLLLVVADGMGGHRGGREASQMAVHHVEEQVFSAPRGDPLRLLDQGVRSANRAIFERAQRDPALAGMGTTCTALLLRDRAAHVAHVGDSRAYRIRGDTIRQLTTDHSWVEQMVQSNLMSKDDVGRHQGRHVLHRAVGVLPEVDVDKHGPERLETGDAFLLCSDGVELVPEERLLAAVRQPTAQDACDVILQNVAELGAHDDATVVVAFFR
jgi:PPM family protein phosphatase